MATFTKAHSRILAEDAGYILNEDGHLHSEGGRVRLFLGDRGVAVEEKTQGKWSMKGHTTHNEFHNLMTTVLDKELRND